MAAMEPILGDPLDALDAVRSILALVNREALLNEAYDLRSLHKQRRGAASCTAGAHTLWTHIVDTPARDVATSLPRTGCGHFCAAATHAHVMCEPALAQRAQKRAPADRQPGNAHHR